MWVELFAVGLVEDTDGATSSVSGSDSISDSGSV